LQKPSKHGILFMLLYAAGTAHTAGGWSFLPKGGEIMRFTFTFYVGHKTITLSILVKSKNRHSAK